jgi:uncharacterized membrane protein
MSLEHGAQDDLGWQSSDAVDVTRRRLAENQRWLSLGFGGGLLLGASSRRSVPLALAGAMLLYRGATGRWPLADWLGLNGAPERRHAATSVPYQSGIKVERSIIIQKSPEEIYRFWRALENLPRFMSQHVSVEHRDNARSHWKVASIGGATFEWDAEIVNDVPNELLAWRSLDGADLNHAGSVHFESDARGGARVKVVLEYRPPAGKWSAEVARLFGQEPGQVLDKDLRRLKQLLETGEIPSTEGQPRGA